MGLLLAGTDNRWKTGPALQGERGERGGGEIGGWMGEGRGKRAWCMKTTTDCDLCGVHDFFLLTQSVFFLRKC